MNKSANPTTVVAQDIRELKKALQGAVPVGMWAVEQGPHGHASIVCYDAHGNRQLVIRNKR